jgi:hypothetical protein
MCALKGAGKAVRIAPVISGFPSSGSDDGAGNPLIARLANYLPITGSRVVSSTLVKAATIPEEVEAYRDRTWRRMPELRVETAVEAEQLVESLGFCAAMTDARRGGPSLYISVCGRRDAYTPRNVQKDPECSLAWITKDELMRRGRVYYAKLAKGRSTFIARRLIPHFNAVWGVGGEGGGEGG